MSQVAASPASLKTSTVAPRAAMWTPWQLRWAMARVVMLTAMLAGLFLFDAKSANLLFAHPLGAKMLLAGLLLAALGFAIEFFAWMAINRWLPPGNVRRQGARVFISSVLGTVLFVVFFLPVIFACINGPAVITIMETLTKSP